jgi:DNA repair protein RecO (recombination protein O)
MDTGFILNRRPFRDNSLLVDLFTKESGRITCIARVAKKRGKIMKGTLEPFRLLTVDWIGKGDVQTLTLAEEKGRYRIPVTDLCPALYLNELLLKLIPKYAPAEDVFYTYQRAISQLANQSVPISHCEMDILQSLGYAFRSTAVHATGQAVHVSEDYRFSIESGLMPIDNIHTNNTIPISGRLLIKLNESSTLDLHEETELRKFLDQLINLLLAGKILKSRKLAFGY